MSQRRHPFDQVVERSGAGIRLAEAALLFALDHRRGLKPGVWLKRLDALGERVDRLGARTADEKVAALRCVLVDQELLRGDKQDYYDPRNSYLNEVLSRRRGIPISLAAVWLDVAEQLGWPLVGVGLPGHFLIKYAGPEEEVFVDVFEGGQVLTRDECPALVARVVGRALALTDAHFEAVGVKAILTRMLHNLRAIFLQRQMWYNAACVLARLCALHPESDELRQQLAAAGNRLAELN